MLLNHIWYGYAVIIPGALFVVITLMLLRSRFHWPDGGCWHRERSATDEQ